MNRGLGHHGPGESLWPSPRPTPRTPVRRAGPWPRCASFPTRTSPLLRRGRAGHGGSHPKRAGRQRRRAQAGREPRPGIAHGLGPTTVRRRLTRIGSSSRPWRDGPARTARRRTVVGGVTKATRPLIAPGRSSGLPSQLARWCDDRQWPRAKLASTIGTCGSGVFQGTVDAPRGRCLESGDADRRNSARTLRRPGEEGRDAPDHRCFRSDRRRQVECRDAPRRALRSDQTVDAGRPARTGGAERAGGAAGGWRPIGRRDGRNLGLGRRGAPRPDACVGRGAGRRLRSHRRAPEALRCVQGRVTTGSRLSSRTQDGDAERRAWLLRPGMRR